MGYESDTYAFCYRGGDVGRLVTYMAMWTPVFLWSSYTGFASYTRELYFVYQSHTWWVTAGVLYILRNLSEWNAPAPQASCTSADVSGPSYVVALLAHYLLMLALDRVYWRRHVSRTEALAALVLTVSVPGVLLWSGSVGVPHVVQGALVGTSVALVCSYFLLFFFLYARFALLATGDVARRLSLGHAGPAVMSHFYGASGEPTDLFLGGTTPAAQSTTTTTTTTNSVLVM